MTNVKDHPDYDKHFKAFYKTFSNAMTSSRYLVSGYVPAYFADVITNDYERTGYKVTVEDCANKEVKLVTIQLRELSQYANSCFNEVHRMIRDCRSEKTCNQKLSYYTATEYTGGVGAVLEDYGYTVRYDKVSCSVTKLDISW